MSPTKATVTLVSIGLLLTALISWTAWTLNRHNERRLLVVQTQQAGAVVASTINSIRDPLATSLEIETATNGDVKQFYKFMSAYTGKGQLFASASLWKKTGTSLRALASIGTPELPPASTEARVFIAHTFVSTPLEVIGIPHNQPRAIGYAISDTKNSTYVIYAERTIPADRQAKVEGNTAFSDLDYATYLGRTTRLTDLTTTDLPVSQLPLSGDTDRISIPFGDTTLTLTTAPRRQLGGTLGGQLAWIFLLAGGLLTIIAAIIVEQFVKRKRVAERDAKTISGLYEHVDSLYGEQRTIAETLQRALSPQHNPTVANLEIGSRYIAGAVGVEIGGDWYSSFVVGENHFAFAVGDVSGRGLSAATVMARLRFYIQAYLLEGHSPDVVLEMCSRQINVATDGHFSTVLIGILDLATGEIIFANAGHLNPLLVSGTASEYVITSVGPPLGVASSTYLPSTVVLSPGSMLLAFTDGLVERSEESIEVGLDRLARAATVSDLSLEDLLSSIVSRLSHDGPSDDIAILAIKWRDPS
jgi:serine phosphatase RsbU (regulator of sigma subunit)